MLSFVFALLAPIVFVPLDDRPVTYQLPLMLGRIAGVPIAAPPRELLGTYLQFGKPDAIVAWMNGSAPRSDSYVLSSDMLAYGGLVGSRVPGVSYADAYFRLHSLAQVRNRNRGAWIGAFGTVMRLAPTGVPAIGDATDFFAAGPVWPDLQAYANLHDPPVGDEVGKSQRLAARLGPALDAYLQTRLRNYSVDHLLVDLAKAGTIDRLVLGQDDAKPFGLHVKDLNALQAHVAEIGGGDAVSIEPGADELGMALLARVLARKAHWTPHVAVMYSRPDGEAYQDPLEFAPLGTTVESLIALCGGVRDENHPDLWLFVRVPHTGQTLDDTLYDELDTWTRKGYSVALTDLSFEESYEAQGSFARRVLSGGVASRLDAYSAWNTAANTIGTALGEAIAAGAGRRMRSYDRLAHETFTFMRFADDVDFHVRVRPDLNDWLASNGTADHTLLLPEIAASASTRNNALLWNDAAATLAELYPNLHIAAMRITLPWDRTFETEIEVSLAPNL